VREFDRAMDDFTRGARLDSTIYGIWYHLGVLHFVRGDFADAADAFKRSQPRAPDAGELAGSTDWLWMSLMRAGRAAEAKAMLARRPDSLATNVAYAQRLRLYRGEIGPNAVMTPADTGDVAVATLSFGIGNWYLVNGDTARARSWFERSVRSGGWPGFGFIASEAELRRLAPGSGGPNDAANQQPISAGRRVGGFILTYAVGFGSGHAVVGKYSEAGKYFTMGELGGFALATGGLGIAFSGCGECGGAAPLLFYAGFGSFLVARIWEIVDVVVRPAQHNAAVDAARKAAAASSLGLTLAPIIQNGRRGIGVGMRF
jgi:tetratricopeptide (TPR) repeat protein